MKQVTFDVRENHYQVSETIEETTNNDSFHLHDHKLYEIMFFLEGDSKYIVEGKEYFLESGDIIIVRKQEMHRIFHNSNAKYRRMVLFVEPEFCGTDHNGNEVLRFAY